MGTPMNVESQKNVVNNSNFNIGSGNIHIGDKH